MIRLLELTERNNAITLFGKIIMAFFSRKKSKTKTAQPKKKSAKPAPVKSPQKVTVDEDRLLTAEGWKRRMKEST